MSDSIITVEGLGKRYRLGAQSNERYTALRDVIADKAKSLFRRNGGPSSVLRPPTSDVSVSESQRLSVSRPSDEFWALKNVSFEVRRGEVLGIIGRNGAGKSTLLKILSRITEPTEGRIKIKGRVASLLEVGTGFHPELTGRENIYLNGAILGMHRQEIKAKFDEIVAFAEIDRFLDTPVKRYSSGMYVRLAFAVAAHLEPEILVIDEVLAVGDSEFQKKCLGKMNQVAQSGRTVLFVSHNMAVVQHLCTRAVLLRLGAVVATDTPQRAISTYLSDAPADAQVDLTGWRDRVGSGEARIKRVEIEVQNFSSEAGMPPTLRIRLFSEFFSVVARPTFGVIIHDSTGVPLLDLRSTHSGFIFDRVIGPCVVTVSACRLALYPGRYLISPWIMDAGCRTDIDFPRLCCAFDVSAWSGRFGDLKLDSDWGKYFVESEWTVTAE